MGVLDTDSKWMIDCDSLTKRYGDFHALSDCSLKVRRGDVFGLLGPNGAGKTTLIRLLLGYVIPTSGACQVDGRDALADSVSVRRSVSYLPGDARLPRHMRGSGVLRFFSEMHPDGDLSRSLAIADRLELDLRRHVAFMSTGMRQKLALAVVLGPQTPLLILDEPTANLDPTVRSEVLKCVLEASDAGRTVVLSSHVLSEIEDTCQHVAFLRQGEVAHQLAMSDLFQQHRITGVLNDASAANAMQLQNRITANAPAAFANQLRVSVKSVDDLRWSLRIDTAGDLAVMLGWLDELGFGSLRIEPLGLRAIYDAVHFDQPIPMGTSADTTSLVGGESGQVIS